MVDGITMTRNPHHNLTIIKANKRYTNDQIILKVCHCTFKPEKIINQKKKKRKRNIYNSLLNRNHLNNLSHFEINPPQNCFLFDSRFKIFFLVRNWRRTYVFSFCVLLLFWFDRKLRKEKIFYYFLLIFGVGPISNDTPFMYVECIRTYNRYNAI